uniref:Uncharacterized protein n=1 Tax=Ammopiptanthus mongolicus TaxID=126911 RepID=A0A4P8PGR0_AMMMO|nr:hypothetical protein [Ammopiptanthus mongolicus]
MSFLVGKPNRRFTTNKSFFLFFRARKEAELQESFLYMDNQKLIIIVKKISDMIKDYWEKKKNMSTHLLLSFVLPVFGSFVAGFFGRFLGSEGSAIMTTPSSLVLFSIFILGLIFLFRCVKQKKKSGFLLLFFYISILFFISLYGYSLRIYFISRLGLYLYDFLPFLIFSVSEGRVISYSGGSNPGGGSSHMGGSSRDSGWTDFDLAVLAEPSSETEMEGTSVNSSIPRGDEAGPSHQESVVQDRSLESSLRNRIVRLERDNSPFLLDKAKGEYWAHIKTELDQAPSQDEYNRLLDFENRDLQIREKKHDCLSLFQQVLAHHPALAEQAPYNPQEALMDFFNERRDQLDQQLPDLDVWERDVLELNWLNIVRQGLKDGGPAYVLNTIFTS